MKKILMAAVALICMTAVSLVFTSCEKEKTEIKNVTVYYALDTNQLDVAEDYKETALRFKSELESVLQSIEYEQVDEAVLVQRIQEVVDKYNHFCFRGVIYLMRSFDQKNYSTVATYTMTLKLYYKLNTSELICADGQEETARKFKAELEEILEGAKEEEEIDESLMFQRIQVIIDKYNHSYLKGNIYLTRSFDDKTYSILKTFTLEMSEGGDES